MNRLRSRRPAPQRLRARAGFTMVELVVTILVLTIGLLGLAATSAVVTKQMGSGNKNSVAAVVAQARLDSIASLNCVRFTGTPSGTSSSRGITESWFVRDSNDVKVVVDTVRILGRVNPFIYRSMIPCRD